MMKSRTKWNWFPAITRKGQPVLFNSFAVTAFQDQYYQEALLLPRGIHFLKYVGGPRGLVVLEASDADTLGGNLAEHVTPDYLSFFVAQCHHKSDRLLRTAHEIRLRAPYDSLSNTNLTTLFTAYSSDVIRVMTFLTTIVVFENVLQEALEQKLTAHCQEHNIKADPAAYLFSLLLPPEKNIPSLAIVELYKLAAEAYSNSSLRKLFGQEPVVGLTQMRDKFPAFAAKFDTYLEKYDFMDMQYYAGRPLLPKELFARIKEVIDDAKDRISCIEQDRKDSEAEFKKVSDELKLTPELRSLVRSVQEIHYLRQYRADALFKAGRDVIELLMTIAERLNTNYDSIIMLAHDEIATSIIKGELTVSKQIIKTRQEGYAILWVDQRRSIVTGNKFIKELTLFPVEKKETKELQGNIASRGTYQGPVTIVTLHEEISKVQPGDVLVSPMTDPYFVPAMVRAGAIITDEGGILSHAAIISREFGIPCIVGTGIATSVLKDGIIVQVDASGEKGRVRIIEK